MKQYPEARQHGKLAVGVSSCLLGDRVRYDGGHKANSTITETLGKVFEFRGFCPEIEIGLGVPRKPIFLIRKDPDEIRCVSVDDAGNDYTDKLRLCAEKQKHWHAGLCGYIVKKDSPSCGMERVEVRSDDIPADDGIGIYAAKMMENYPFLPVVDEAGLRDPVSLENFMQRVFALGRWREMVRSGLEVKALLDFHARHQLIIKSHDQGSARKLEQLVAAVNTECLEKNASDYLRQFMQALKIPAG